MGGRFTLIGERPFLESIYEKKRLVNGYFPSREN